MIGKQAKMPSYNSIQGIAVFVCGLTYAHLNRYTYTVNRQKKLTPRYVFEYLANGRVGRVYDRKLNRIASSAYDLAERPMTITWLENTPDDVNTGAHMYTGTVAYDE